MKDTCRLLGSAAALLLAFAGPAGAQTIVKPTFTVRAVDTPYLVGDPFVAASNDGTCLLAWTEVNVADASSRVTYTQPFSAAGIPLAPPQRVDGGLTPIRPEISADATGGYALAFSRLAASPLLTPYGRRLDSAGAPLGSPSFVGNGASMSAFLSVAALPTGAVFQWGESGLRFRLYDLNGAPRGASVLIANLHSGPNNDVAALSDGGFASIWLENVPPLTSRVRAYDGNGQPRGAAVAPSPAFTVQQVAADPLGGFGVIGTSGSQIWAARYHADGTQRGPSFQVGSEAAPWVADAEIEFDSQGNLFAIWATWSQSTFERGPLRARGFDADDVAIGPIVTLEAAPTNFPVRTARLANDTFISTWPTDGGPILANIVSLCAPGAATCGDGAVQPQCEQCDDGAGNSDVAADACRTTCRRAGCGDGVVDSGEECDDGNRFSRDGCDQNCLVESCGNGRREVSEICDDGNLVDGDGCDSNCRPTGCGNGLVSAGEECDDSNRDNGDGCDRFCLLEDCGNGRKEDGEICDDGNAVEGDGCDSNCTFSLCGNTIVSPIEECDDGNIADGDGCDASCRQEICGNGRRDGNEGCDDGNAIDDDGCQSDCTPTPQVDALLLPVRPLRITLPANASSLQKRVRVRLRHAGTGGVQLVRLTASDGTCPAGTVTGDPDLDPVAAGSQNLAAVAPGQSTAAVLTLEFQRAAFALVDRQVSRRCAISVAAAASPGTFDVTASNDTIAIAVDVSDGAAPSSSVPEFYLRPMAPQALSISPGLLSSERRLRVKVLGTTAAGATLTAADGDCPLGSIAVTRQPSGTGAGEILLRASRSFYTTRAGSPVRCTATLTATSAAADTEPTNNTTSVMLDVIDRNDF